MGVPERFGGISRDPATQSQTLALIGTELASADAGLADKLVQNWKISVLLSHFASERLQEYWFTRYMAEP